MFAVVRTGGKQYRVAAGDKIAVEKLAGSAGDTIRLGEVLLAGEGETLADAAKVVVSAEIIAQDRSEKVTVFKKRRRHNYRRKKGHRQQHTILKIVAIGDHKEEKAAPAKAAKAAKPEAAPAKAPAPKADPSSPAKVDAQPTPNPAPDNEQQANPPHQGDGAPEASAKPATAKAAAKDKPTAKTPSTENAAPAKAPAKKTPKAK